MGVEGLKKPPRHSDVPITKRTPITREVPTEHLDRLLVTVCDIPPDASVERAATAVIATAFDVLEGVAIGACIPGEHGRQIVLRRSERVSHTSAPDPTRLFPEFSMEHILEIPSDDGSTLHIATDDPARFAAGSESALFADRVALALGSAIRRARMHAHAASQSAEMHHLHAQVIQAEKLASLGQIAAGIVHELNNPLTSIVAYSDYLHRRAITGRADPSDIERLRRINEAAERILRFSRDLIAYSRPSTEVPGAVSIHDVIDRALIFCEHVLGNTGVMVDREFGEIRPVRGVAGQLTQVFVNLFTNAAHAMQEQGGVLKITTTMETEQEVRIAISDDGHGIDTEHLPRIFDPFFTTKTDGTGTGLGLSIVRNIVASHGGHIRAACATPRGTIFYVNLPVVASPNDG